MSWPTPGGDFRTWGTKLLAILQNSHNEDGSIKDSVKNDLVAEIVPLVPGGAKGDKGDPGEGLVELPNSLGVVGGFMFDADTATSTSFGSDGKPVPEATALIAGALTDEGYTFGGGGAVDSVNGATGAVVLTAEDVGAVSDGTSVLLRTTVREASAFTSLPATSNATLADGILNQANLYTLGTYIPANWSGTGTISTFGGTTEHYIRHPAAAAFALAAALATGTHDEAETSTTTADATVQAVRLVEALARLHKANGGTWGGAANTAPPNTSGTAAWQAAYWARLAGMAGWLVWDDLTTTTQEHVAQMAVWEADRMLTWTLPYWKNRSGTEVYAGDSKSEELAWDASALVLALWMLPDHRHADAWMRKLVEMGLASSAMPSDLLGTDAANGAPLADILDGTNVSDDGIVTNHSTQNPDYMAAPFESLWGALWGFAATGADAPAAITQHAADVYAAFSTYEFDDGGTPRTIYTSGSYELFYPDGSSWGAFRQAHVSMVDVVADAYGWDTGLGTSAETWAGLHLQRMADMQARFATGKTYTDSTEDSYTGREQWVAQHAAHIVLTYCTAPARISDATPDLLVQRNRRR